MKFLSTRVAGVAVSATVLVAAGSGIGPAAAQPASWLDDLVGTCPALYTLAVQGTGQSAPDAPVKADTGMLGTVIDPLLNQARALGASVDRAYIPYPAAFGGAVPGGKDSYATSVGIAEENLREAAKRVVSQCPDTKLAVLGYSQGAHAASVFLDEVGSGKGIVPAAAVAGAALFGSPARAEGAGIFPGTRQSSPSPVPGTSGGAVKALPAVSVSAPVGAGIAPKGAISGNYGSLSGRVSSWCESGDLACDAPPNAPIARAVVNVAGQAEVGGDPILALSTIGKALGSTVFNVAVDVVNEDIQVPRNAIENLSITPHKTISERLAEASDPAAKPPTQREALSALMKAGLVAANAVVSVAQEVITPQTIAAVAAVGLADPAAAFAILAAKTVSAAVNLIPPTTTNRVVSQAFTVVQNEVKANRDLFDLAALSNYRNASTAHSSYAAAPVTADGQPATKFVGHWLAAAAADLENSTTDSARSTSPTAVTVPTSTTVPAQSTTTVTSEPLTQGGVGAIS